MKFHGRSATKIEAASQSITIKVIIWMIMRHVLLSDDRLNKETDDVIQILALKKRSIQLPILFLL